MKRRIIPAGRNRWRCGGDTAALLHRAAGQCARAALRAAGQPDAARPDHHHRGGDGKSRLDGVGHAVRRERRAAGEAADGRGLHGLRRWPDLSDQAARGAEVARRRAGARAGLRGEPGPLGGARHVRPDGGEVGGYLGRGGRQDRQDHAEAAVPAADRRDRRAELVHHAGAAGEDRSVQGDHRDHRLRPVSVS